ncbi:RdRP-domain-containing protein [Lepidopterella palustris CBS 459.81]|uniref:RNA-dependent RNA polymerase n=1 Tax=Lepidopterella palustris CBS 459.81 TaxID=1314670 RepID=A0A8E2EK10_9PEZI|nr:RdRP-domain-containing protein [Lepidopterella palustris CBS 459.81]
MDIFVQNIPVSCTRDQLEDYFRPVLGRFGIVAFECKKFKSQDKATITIANIEKAQKFLEVHGEPPGQPRGQSRGQPRGQPRLRQWNVRNVPYDLLVRTLVLKEKQILQRQAQQTAVPVRGIKEKSRRQFSFRVMSCGTWSYEGEDLAFHQHFKDSREGSIMFGKSTAVIFLNSCEKLARTCRLDMSYFLIKGILVGNDDHPTISFTLSAPPKIYQEVEVGSFSGTEGLALGMDNLSINSPKDKPKRERLFEIDEKHGRVVSFCMVYRVVLSNAQDILTVNQLLDKTPSLPSVQLVPTKTIIPRLSLEKCLQDLKVTLGNYNQSRTMDFGLLFQLYSLAQNAILPPATVTKLLPRVQRLVSTHGPLGTLKMTVAVHTLASQIPVPGATVEAKEYDLDTLEAQLNEIAGRFTKEGTKYDLADRHKHLALVHKVTVSPCGIFLAGPEPESTNRVLRKYPDYADHFLRVVFADENGDSIHFDGRASQQRIFHERFKKILDHGIDIGGRLFTFLGFSHSSLRSQTCWFMAPLVSECKLVFASQVIQELGDFTQFRSPAKCAARIGQAFSNTTAAISIREEQLMMVADIERNGRVFSDGCGTISRDLLKKVWRGYALGNETKPKVLQIRFAGAKGVISLDDRLTGNQLCIRPSMNKFHGANVSDIEICSAATRRLPMYLNRQFIKILEDLGVEAEVFLHLQATMVESLKRITLSARNAATFLEWLRVGVSAKTPNLIGYLGDLGLRFQDDGFLKDVVEIAALSQLREIKHRSRILVEHGMTLFGIMDETGILEEGQVYIVADVPLSPQWVVITRAPALHPGDIQVAKCVEVPPNSPLSKLQNCVVFSQKGVRDLPSQLSGGDLDGDLYNVIYDPRLMPKRLHPPADYARQNPVDIGRQVERKDMTDFFITFMESDQLGRIATMHQQLADRRDNGTRDPDCISLAKMASTAVDFSKTGIPVDQTKIPYQDYIRPDFMASDPRVIIEDKGILLEENEDEDDKDPVSLLDPEWRTFRYYESQKALGRLYRAIDEKAFFQQMKRDSELSASRDPYNRSLMDKLWTYVQSESILIQWKQYADMARKIRQTYEYNLIDTMDQYSIHPTQPLRELEVFSGSILGKSMGAQNRRVRASAAEMKERFERDVAYIVNWIMQGDDGDRDEAFARSIACFANAMLEAGNYEKKRLKSWRYVSAAVCLQELESFRNRYIGEGLRIWV